MVVIGTMNNAGTVILTIADMSIIEAEVEVDETDIPSIVLGQKAKIKIDAIPDKTFTGSVTEIGNSPIQATSAAAAGQQATNFKVVVTLDGEIPEVRPGFTCTADDDGDAQGVAVPSGDAVGRSFRQRKGQRGEAARGGVQASAAGRDWPPQTQAQAAQKFPRCVRHQGRARPFSCRSARRIAGAEVNRGCRVRTATEVIVRPFNSNPRPGGGEGWWGPGTK
jgi:hypothetical protein